MLKSNEKNDKISLEDLLDKLQEDKIREKIRYVPLNQGGFNGSMLILEVEKFGLYFDKESNIE